MKKIKILSSEEGYNLAADVYDENENYLNSFEQGELIPLLGALAGKKILDVGAGTGRLSLPMANRGAQVIALDVSHKMLEIIWRKSRSSGALDSTTKSKIWEKSAKNTKIITVVGDAENLPFKNETFDIVTAAFLIVHLKDPTRFFDEAYRVLKDGGVLAVTNINQKDPPQVKTTPTQGRGSDRRVGEGTIIIESFYHRPEKIIEVLKSLAFNIEQEVFVKEKELWVNQIVVAKK